MVKIKKMLEKITHIDSDTFFALQRLTKLVDNPYIKGYFHEQLLFTEEDFKIFSENVHSAYAMLEAKCKKGKLHLDLNIENHFLEHPAPTCQ